MSSTPTALVAGHQRIKGLRAIGLTHTPAVMPGAKVRQQGEAQFNLLHNRVETDRLAEQHGLTRVVHRDGARVPVRAWAEAATLATSAVACNAGTLNRTRQAGVHQVEVFDGGDLRLNVAPGPWRGNRPHACRRASSRVADQPSQMPSRFRAPACERGRQKR